MEGSSGGLAAVETVLQTYQLKKLPQLKYMLGCRRRPQIDLLKRRIGPAGLAIRPQLLRRHRHPIQSSSSSKALPEHYVSGLLR
jgi:hypothetical protein